MLKLKTLENELGQKCLVIHEGMIAPVNIRVGAG